MDSMLEQAESLPSQQPRSGPIWRGPEEDGITQSLLGRFLVCRERFRLLVVDGLRPVDTFNHRLEYGSMWHVCEEAVAAKVPTIRWEHKLREYGQALARKYPTAIDQITHWMTVCFKQFPEYIKYWEHRPEEKTRVPLLQEVSFNVPYRLPSGRTVKLRGKWDSVDRIGSGIYLMENKTKGDINEQQIKRQLTFDIQTMVYLVALREHQKMESAASQAAWARPLLGVRYNVIRRPLSGGKGTIRQTKNESTAEYYERLANYIREEPDTYFMRWQVEVGADDIARFRKTCLDPILEQLCDWWDWVNNNADPFRRSNEAGNPHWRHPFGVYNVLDEGGSSDLDEYLATGNEVGLDRTTDLFPELS